LAYYNRGNAFISKHNLVNAIDDYSKAIELDSRYAPAYINRGNARSTKGDLDGGISDFNTAIEIDPRNAQAFGNRGIARSGKGDIAGALADYKQAIEFDPRYTAAYNSLAWLLSTAPMAGVRDDQTSGSAQRSAGEPRQAGNGATVAKRACVAGKSGVWPNHK
jgi:tetratricopeptide (TPR) repeat protein